MKVNTSDGYGYVGRFKHKKIRMRFMRPLVGQDWLPYGVDTMACFIV